MKKLNFENLDLIRDELKKLNSGSNINYQNLSFLSHELYLYLQAWTLDSNTDWELFKSTNHLLKNENLNNDNKTFNLEVLIQLRNNFYYKTINRQDSFIHLKKIFELESSMLKENNKINNINENIKKVA